ncbi:MAG TPA: hypothetical protein VN369_03300 [Terriglobales bacterium]|nr:hypothetical protein [Terriglobales bacterium]
MESEKGRTVLPGRLTYPVPGGYEAKDGAAVLARLGAYEDLHEGLLAENERLAGQLSELRAAGLDRTARHRDLLGKKLQIVYALSLFNARGL